MANTVFTQNTTCLAFGSHRIHHHQFNSKIKRHSFFVLQQNLRLRFQNDATNKRNMAVYTGTTPGAQLPIDPSPHHWKIWILGTMFTILVSFTRGKWGPLLQLKEKVETTIDEAERVVDIVEDVAEKVDELAEEAVKHLPEGKLRDAVEFVENVAEDIDQHAENAEDALQKVEITIDSFFESTTHQKNTAMTKAEEESDQK